MPSVLKGFVSIENITATYSCQRGYRLTGVSVRKCLSNNTWSGSQPECMFVETRGSSGHAVRYMILILS